MLIKAMLLAAGSGRKPRRMLKKRRHIVTRSSAAWIDDELIGVLTAANSKLADADNTQPNVQRTDVAASVAL